jgi:integrase
VPVVALTDRFCQNIKPTKTRVDYFDSKTRGLALRVAPSGVKSFSVHFTAPNGKRARLTLGRYPRLPLAQARALALEGHGRVHDGTDPRGLGTDTVQALVTAYLEKRVRGEKKLRSAQQIERRLVRNVLPILGGKPMAELHRRDITRAIDVIIGRGSPIEAARVAEDMRAMFRWAVSRGDLEFSPMEGMQQPATSVPRERTLSDDEIRTLWEVLPEALPRSKAVQQIIKLCLLTAQRVGEVSGMSRTELDLKAASWTIPAARSKNKRSHTVPLSEPALAVIAKATGDNHLFPNDKGEGPLPAHDVARTIRLAQERFGLDQWTAHDLRRTAVTNMAKLGVSPIVLGHVINHRSVTRAGVTLSVYSQYDYAKEKREALELWAAHLGAIVRGEAKVLPLRGAR